MEKKQAKDMTNVSVLGSPEADAEMKIQEQVASLGGDPSKRWGHKTGEGTNNRKGN